MARHLLGPPTAKTVQIILAPVRDDCLLANWRTKQPTSFFSYALGLRATPQTRTVLYQKRAALKPAPLCVFPKSTRCQTELFPVSLQIAVKTRSASQKSLSQIFITGDFSELHLLLCCRKKRVGKGRDSSCMVCVCFFPPSTKKKKINVENQAKPKAQRNKRRKWGLLLGVLLYNTSGHQNYLNRWGNISEFCFLLVTQI